MSDDEEYLEYERKIKTLEDDKRKLEDSNCQLEKKIRALERDKRNLTKENADLKEKLLKEKEKEKGSGMMKMGENRAEEGIGVIKFIEKNPDDSLRFTGQNMRTSARSQDNSVDGYKMKISDQSPDYGIVIDGKKVETSNNSHEDKKAKSEEIKIGNQSSVNPIEETQGKKTDEQIKQQTAIGTSRTEKPAVDTKHINSSGLVVICCHQTFTQNHKLHKRDNAAEDTKMMKKAWELYGCKVIEFFDENTEFYKTKLIAKIKEELVPDIKMFVFVLSTHGEEKSEAKIGSTVHEIQHYFFTKDGQLNTQQFMNDIAAIEKVNAKLKVFVIQTCRSRFESKDQNRDPGYDIEVTENKSLLKPKVDQDITASKHNIPDDGITKADAKGECTTPVKVEEGIHTFDTMELVPHCDDCIVLFASMAGKNAFSTSNSLYWAGGWVIKSLYDALANYTSEDKVHILDILTAVNCEVGKREVEETINNEMTISKSQSCFFHNIAFEEEALYLQKNQKN